MALTSDIKSSIYFCNSFVWNLTQKCHKFHAKVHAMGNRKMPHDC
jgi:hypothetical protein